MLDSGNKEMEDLARNLFWGSNPSPDDYADLHVARGGTLRYIDDEFDKLKNFCINKFCGKETYESIYGEGTFRESKRNDEK